MNKGERFALATIIQKEGSTPREVGSKMIVQHDGQIFGTVGGDHVEAIVISEAMKVIVTGRSKILDFSLNEEKNMLCGGKMNVFIELVEPKPTLIIIGSGHISDELGKLANNVGFKVIVVDPFREKKILPLVLMK